MKWKHQGNENGSKYCFVFVRFLFLLWNDRNMQGAERGPRCVRKWRSNKKVFNTYSSQCQVAVRVNFISFCSLSLFGRFGRTHRLCRFYWFWLAVVHFLFPVQLCLAWAKPSNSNTNSETEEFNTWWQPIQCQEPKKSFLMWAFCSIFLPRLEHEARALINILLLNVFCDLFVDRERTRANVIENSFFDHKLLTEIRKKVG